MPNSYDVIEIHNYVFLNTLRNFHFREYSIFDHQLELKRAKNRKIVSEYDQEIPQSKTADKPMAPQERATQPSRNTRKTNKAEQPARSSHSR